MKERIRALGTALTFLTRIPLCCHDTAPDSISCSLGYFPAVGGLLGFFALCPVWLGVWGNCPVLQAAVYATLLLWLTRGLHWDGLSDLCDAAGSGARGARFYAILKDSRLGAFGGMGLLVCFVLQVTAAAANLKSPSGTWALLLAPVVGRSLPAFLLWSTPIYPGSRLAVLLLPGATPCRVVWQLLGSLFLISCLLGFYAAVMISAGIALVLWWLRQLACREEGLNGDFLGAAIISGELVVLLGACACVQ